jgi:hypothetical protein
MSELEFLRKGEVLYVVIGRNPWDQPITRRATYAEKRHYEEDVALAQRVLAQ